MRSHACIVFIPGIWVSPRSTFVHIVIQMMNTMIASLVSLSNLFHLQFGRRRQQQQRGHIYWRVWCAFRCYHQDRMQINFLEMWFDAMRCVVGCYFQECRTFIMRDTVVDVCNNDYRQQCWWQPSQSACTLTEINRQVSVNFLSMNFLLHHYYNIISDYCVFGLCVTGMGMTTECS